MIGEVISHYKILEKLGEGGMGIVYKAHDTTLDRTVAVKLLPSQVVPGEEERKRFLQEAKAAATLNHPNACTIYEITEVGDRPCIVMEFVDGETLGKKVPLASVKDAIGVAIQVAEALSEAHSKGVIHRDIKSDNIMVNSRGSVKVMDFGLARLRGEERLTRQATTIGTLAYTAPELLHGADADARSDIFAFGAVLYEMLTGSRPFHGEHQAALMYEILNAEPPSIASYRQDVPPSLQSVVADLMRKDPQKRIPSAAEALRRLREVQGVPAERPAEKTIAVLYFENMSSDRESDYFCAGMTEDIITDLFRIRELKVTPRADVLPFRNREIPTKQIGEALHVRYILEGSVRKHGTRIRISAQLVEVDTGSHLWAERFDGLVEEVFDLQSEVAQKIAESLKVSLSAAQRQELEKKPTTDLRAYDLYLRGRDLVSRRGKNNTVAGIHMLEQAVALDERFVAAYAAIAEACSYMFGWYDGNVQWLTRSVDMSNQALALEPGLAEGQFGLAMVRFYEKRYDEARTILLKVIGERPEFYDAYRWLGILADLAGAFDDALRWYEKCAVLKPYSEEPSMHAYMTYTRQGNTQKRTEALRRMVNLGLRKLEVNPDDAVTMSRIAGPMGELGDREKALDLLKQITELAPDDGLVMYNAACGFSQIGQIDRAIDCLRRAAQLGYKNTRDWVKNDPDLEPVRNHPSYRSVIEAFG
ncbi:MAG TPA: protein kinase [Bacteroidota bacterium]|nr:protein kinase [Bacteroidota bacterium]